MRNEVLSTLAFAVGLGVLGQVLAAVSRLPAIVFLLLLGVLAGPGFLGVVNPKVLGAGLPILTAVFVALILFEGGLSLRPGVLRGSVTSVRRLTTVGVLVTLAAGTVLARLTMEMPWSTAVLFASLVVVTGPTVVTPILRRIRLTSRLSATLRGEGILIDAVGAVTAVVVLRYVIDLSQAGTTWTAAAAGFFGRLGAGVAVGGALGGAAVLLARTTTLRRHEGAHLINLGGIGLALGAFAASEHLFSESGITAAVTAGMVVAAAGGHYREELEHYKEQLVVLGVSVLFILLAADVDMEAVAQAGPREAILIGGLMLVVRPLAVLASTVGTTLTRNERIYAGLLAPRGIVAAAMAGHFADQLQRHGIAGGESLEALVFMTIAATVLVQGAWAGPLADLLRVRAHHAGGTLLVGVNDWSLAVAHELKRRGALVRFLDSNSQNCATAAAHGFSAHQGDASDEKTYEQLDLGDIGRLVAMTPNDAVNTLACDAAVDWMGRENVLQVVAKPPTGAQRAKVRLSGGRAMPTHLSHHAVTYLLSQRLLTPAEYGCPKPTAVAEGMHTPSGPMVPLLIVEKQRVRPAVEGATCPAGGIIVGLVETPAAQPAPADEREADPAAAREASPPSAGERVTADAPHPAGRDNL